LNNTQF